MNLKLIGDENLPNVYIESVNINTLFQSGNERKDMGAELDVKIKVYDGLNRRGVPYFSDYGTNPKKQVLLILSKDSNFTEILTNQGGVLNPKKLRSLPNYNSSNVEYQIFSAPRNARLSKSKETEISYKKKFKLSKSDSHAALFACVIKEYPSRYDNGPVTSELIMVGGEVVKRAFYFKESVSGLVWGGPVHRHPNNGFMGGSFHSNQPHPRLDKIDFQNTKIKDNRVKNTQMDLSIRDYNQDKKELSNYHFGPLLSSQSHNGALNFLFNIDVFQIMRDFSTNNKLEKTNEELFYNLASTSTIKDFEIYYNTKSDKTFKLISKTYQQNERLKTTYTDVLEKKIKFVGQREEVRGEIEAIVEELILNREPELKTFNCQIKKKNIHQIKIKISIRDPLREYLSSTKKRIEQSISSLKKYHTRLKKPVNYNKDSEKTTDAFKAKYSRRTEMWYTPIKVFEEMIKLNSKINNKEVVDLLTNMFLMLNPRSLTIDSCEKAIQLFSKEYDRYVRSFNLKKRESFSRTNPTARANTGKNQINLSKIYTVDFKLNSRMLDVMPTLDIDKQIPIMTITQFFENLTTETGRYQIDLPSQSILNNRSRDIFFVGPKKIVLKQNEYSVENLEATSEESLKKVVDISNEKLSLDLGFSNLLVQRYIEPSDVSVEPTSQFGETSPFQANLDERAPTRRRLNVPTNIRRISSFSRNRRSGIQRNRTLFSPDSQNNIFAARTQLQVDKIPIHLKDLTYKSELFGTEKETFFKEQPNKRSIMYENIYKINILSEMVEDSNLRTPLNSRTILEPTERQVRNIEEPTYCVMNKYVENNVLEEDNEFKRFTPVNTLFILIPDNWNFQRVNPTIQTTSPELSFLYDQMIQNLEVEDSALRTILVTQNESRQTGPEEERRRREEEGTRRRAENRTRRRDEEERRGRGGEETRRRGDEQRRGRTEDRRRRRGNEQRAQQTTSNTQQTTRATQRTQNNNQRRSNNTTRRRGSSGGGRSGY